MFGGNTRKALANWVKAQRDRITQIQSEVSQLRVDATTTVDAERVRLADVVKDIRTVQIPALKERELVMLGKIDEVRQTESPVIATARDEIQRLRESAETQVAQSNELINRLRAQLGNKDNADEVQTAIDEQSERVRTASSEIELLTEERIALEGEYRKLEAEVGPIKYIAEFVYGDNADSNMLEEAVRWVIMIIIFVFDPLAVLLLIASQYTFEFRHKKLKDDDGERLRRERAEYEQARAQRIIDNPVFNIDTPTPPAEQKEEINDIGIDARGEVEEPPRESAAGTGQQGRSNAEGMAMAREDDNGQLEPIEGGEVDERVDQSTDSDIQDGDVEPDERDRKADDEESLSGRGDVEPTEEQVPDSDQTQERTSTEQDAGGSATASEEIQERIAAFDEKEKDETYQINKEQWKQDHPNETIKLQKALYIEGKIDKLPWEPEEDLINDETGYIQNEEQGSDKLWNKIKDND